MKMDIKSKGFKVFARVVILIVVFLVGGLVGAHVDRYVHGSKGEYGFKAIRTAGPGGNMMYALDSHKGAWTFGTISAISGNKITITNNAGESQTVVSQADTRIVAAGGTQIGLSGLKTGNNINVFGSTDQNNQITATAIMVQ